MAVHYVTAALRKPHTKLGHDIQNNKKSRHFPQKVRKIGQLVSRNKQSPSYSKYHSNQNGAYLSGFIAAEDKVSGCQHGGVSQHGLGLGVAARVFHHVPGQEAHPLPRSTAKDPLHNT